MEDGAAFLAERVLPDVPYRQWVMSFPRRLRLALAIDSTLTTRVLAITVRAIFAWQRRRARRLGWRLSRTGAVTFIQRFSSALRLNVHFHCLVPDGVFASEPPPAGEPSFFALPPPCDEEVEAINRKIARKTLLLFRSVDPAERGFDDSALERLYTAALHPPRRPGFDLSVHRPRCSSIEGFSLHADVGIAAGDRARLERVCRYGLRPPVAHERIEVLPSGNLAYRMKRTGPDGATHRVMSPPEFLSALASLVPPPRVHLTRYHGLFAPHARARRTVRDASNTAVIAAEQPAHPVDSPSTDRPLLSTSSDVPSPKCGRPDRLAYRLPWAELLKKVFAIDILVCDRCGDRRRIVAAITQPDVADAILRCLGSFGACEPARAPPAAAVHSEP